MAKCAELLLVDASLCQRAVLQRMLTTNGFTVTAFPDLKTPGVQITTQRFDRMLPVNLAGASRQRGLDGDANRRSGAMDRLIDHLGDHAADNISARLEEASLE